MLYLRSINRFLLVSLALFGLSVSSANAATLTSSDWLAAGDNLLTIDGNGLHWLDLSQTANMSFTTVNAQLAAGGTFDGFRYATLAEVEGLWNSADGDDNYYSGWSPQNNGVFDTLAPFWGDLYCAISNCLVGYGYSQALTAYSDTAGSHAFVYIYDLVSHSLSASRDFLEETGTDLIIARRLV
jgi:hypothetical protein